jgi:hypothetical protein
VRLRAACVTAHALAPLSQDTRTLLSCANLTHRGARDARAFYVLQIELDLLIAPAAPEDDADVDADADADAAASSSSHARHAEPHAAAPAAPPPWRGNVRIMGGVNEEAITRVWLARRDARGGFLSCDAPTGAARQLRGARACADAAASARRRGGRLGDAAQRSNACCKTQARVSSRGARCVQTRPIVRPQRRASAPASSRLAREAAVQACPLVGHWPLPDSRRRHCGCWRPPVLCSL